jgi:CubicO group peptidase (beta-lactamase class C family)
LVEAASLSKPVFAYFVLQMCQSGKLDLDAPLWDYLAYSDLESQPDARSITARQVLSHTSGLPNWRDRPGQLRLLSRPGERFGYSGEGYVFLQLAVERITGVPLGELMRKSVLPDLGMPSSGFVWREAFATDAAEGHLADGALVELRRGKRANAASSLVTSAADYAQFVSRLLGNGRDRLMRGWLRQALEPAVEVAQGLSWGLGWGLAERSGQRSFWHWGNNPGYRCFAAASREAGLGVVVMTNGAEGMRICREVVQMTLGYDHPAFSLPLVTGEQ